MMVTTDLSNPPPQTDDFSEIWPFLEAGIHKLMDFPEKISATEYLNLTLTVYNLALRSRTCALSIQKNLTKTFIKRVELTANRMAANLVQVDVDLLKYYVEEFQGYKTGVERVNRVFAFYNRRWAAKKIEEKTGAKESGAKKVKAKEIEKDVISPVDTLGLTQWKENFTLVAQRDGKRITFAIIRLIMQERNGEEIDEDLVKSAIDTFIALDIIDHQLPSSSFYQEEFAEPFLQETGGYYKKELEKVFLSENFVPDNLNKLEENILEEGRRSRRYLPQQTHDRVISTYRDQCEALAQVLLETSEDEKLRGMYTLLSRIKPDGLEELKGSISLHLKTESDGDRGVNEWNMGGMAAPVDNDSLKSITAVSGKPKSQKGGKSKKGGHRTQQVA